MDETFRSCPATPRGSEQGLSHMIWTSLEDSTAAPNSHLAGYHLDPHFAQNFAVCTALIQILYSVFLLDLLVSEGNIIAK